MYGILFIAFLLAGSAWETEGALAFTNKPKSPLYVMEGTDAKINWDFSVGDRMRELQEIIWKVFSIADNRPYPMLVENSDGNITVSKFIPHEYKGRVEKTRQATLVIKNVSSADSTTFTCFLQGVLGVAGTYQSAVELVVIGQASVLPQTDCLKADNSATFTCNATGVPSVNFTWWRDYGESKEQLVDDGQHIRITTVTGSSALAIKDSGVNDTGYYVCHATAIPKQPNMAQGYLEVKKQDPVQEDDKANPERYLSVDIGDDKALCCPVKGYPPPFVTWEKNGTQLKKTVDKCLTITSAKDVDLGNYTCSATDGTTSVGPYTFSLMKKRTGDVSLDIPDKSAQKAVTLNWSDVPGAQYFVVKITGNDLRDDMMCHIGKESTLELHYNALVFKKAENNPEETRVCVKVLALNENDDVIAKSPTCRKITIKSGQVTLNPSIMCLLLIVFASWKMW